MRAPYLSVSLNERQCQEGPRAALGGRERERLRCGLERTARGALRARIGRTMKARAARPQANAANVGRG